MRTFFSCPENAKIVEKSMTLLMDAMKKYDTDNSMRLSKSETDQLFQDLLPSFVDVYSSVKGELVQVKKTLCTRSLPAPPPYPPSATQAKAFALCKNNNNKFVSRFNHPRRRLLPPRRS